jgi:hypothetical protein
MLPEERQEAAGVHLQWTFTEAMSAFRDRKMASDDSCVVISDEPCLDTEGRIELDHFLTACWNGEPEILAKLKSVQDIGSRGHIPCSWSADRAQGRRYVLPALPREPPLSRGLPLKVVVPTIRLVSELTNAQVRPRDRRSARNISFA